MSSPAPRDIDPVPTLSARVDIHVVEELPPASDAAALAVPVIEGDRPPADLGTDWSQLNAVGLHRGAGPGRGPAGPGRASPRRPRESATRAPSTRRGCGTWRPTFARAVPQHHTLAVELADGQLALSPADFAQAVVEGVLLARWRFFVGAGGDEPTLASLTIVARVGPGGRGPRRRRARSGDRPGPRRSAATCPTAPPAPSRPSGWARSPSEVAPLADLDVEVFDRAAAASRWAAAASSGSTGAASRSHA